MGAGRPLYDFIGTMGCTAMAYGPNPPTMCTILRNYFPFPTTTFYALLGARWLTMQSQNRTSN